MSGRPLFIADDFGRSRAINRAIVHAHRAGALDGASLMMGQPATADAVALARSHPDLQVGLHVHLTDAVPVTRTSWPWGSSPARAGWAIGLRPSARRVVTREIASQWRLFQRTGLPCRFLNAHHHLHLHPFVYRRMIRTVGGAFRGWVRLGVPKCLRPTGGVDMAGLRPLTAGKRKRCPFPSSDSFWLVSGEWGKCADAVRTACERVGEGLHEFVFHPRHIGDRDSECLLALRSG